MNDFDIWMKSVDPKYCATDDNVKLRLLRKCWDEARSQGYWQGKQNGYESGYEIGRERARRYD